MEAGIPHGSRYKGVGINENVTKIGDVKKEELRDLHKLTAVKAVPSLPVRGRG
jgi:hypothetical protein